MGGSKMRFEELVDFAYFITDFNEKAFSNENIERLYGVKVSDRTDLIEAVKIYTNKKYGEV